MPVPAEAELALSRFVETICSHELATGLKALSSHDQIIAYGQGQGFDFSAEEWAGFFDKDFELQTELVQRSILSANPVHWSWAFRQHSVWRAMLMIGAGDGST